VPDFWWFQNAVHRLVASRLLSLAPHRRETVGNFVAGDAGVALHLDEVKVRAVAGAVPADLADLSSDLSPTNELGELAIGLCELAIGHWELPISPNFRVELAIGSMNKKNGAVSRCSSRFSSCLLFLLLLFRFSCLLLRFFCSC
jgi:hypothetical protein